MRNPIHAGDFFSVELHLFVKGSAQRVAHATLDGAAQRFWIDHESAIVSAHQPLHPDVTGFSIHIDFSDDRQDGLATESVRNTTASQNILP